MKWIIFIIVGVNRYAYRRHLYITSYIIILYLNSSFTDYIINAIDIIKRGIADVYRCTYA